MRGAGPTVLSTKTSLNFEHRHIKCLGKISKMVAEKWRLGLAVRGSAKKIRSNNFRTNCHINKCDFGTQT